MNLLTPEQRVIKHFNKCAHDYGNAYHARSVRGHFFKRRQEIILSLLDRFDGGRLLDVGCGPGLMAEPCLDKGFSFSGIDISEAMIAKCHERFGSGNSPDFSVGKLQKLPFPNALFDVVLCMGALEYITADEESTAISEMGRVTRSGGLLIVSCLNESSPYWILNRYVYMKARRYYTTMTRRLSNAFLGRKVDEGQDDAPIREFSEELCRCLLQSHGFFVVDTIYYGINVFPRPFDRKFPRLSALANEKLEHLSEGRLKRLAMAFIMVARKEAAGAPVRIPRRAWPKVYPS